MKAKQYEGKTLHYLVVEPDGYDPGRQYPMVVLLHGYGAHMGDLARLCPAIDREGYLFICPNAPIPVHVGLGMQGYAWLPRGADATPEDAQRAEELLATLFDEVMEQFHVEPGQAVLGGFSQGGMMTYRCGLPFPGRFRGLMALSGRLLGPEGLRSRLPASRDQAVFIAHGTDDTLVPVESAREARRFLEGEGYAPEYREYPIGHQITQDVLDDLVEWVHRVLPPLRLKKGD